MTAQVDRTKTLDLVEQRQGAFVHGLRVNVADFARWTTAHAFLTAQDPSGRNDNFGSCAI